jgi:hypothetical protein
MDLANRCYHVSAGFRAAPFIFSRAERRLLVGRPSSLFKAIMSRKNLLAASHPSQPQKGKQKVRSSKELFEIVRALYIPGLDEHTDRLMKICEVAMEKRPDDPITLSLLESMIGVIVGSKDAVEIKQQAETLTPEQRESFEEIHQMTDDQLHQLSESVPLIREFITKVLFSRDERRWLDDEIKCLGIELQKMTAERRQKATE